MKSIALRSIPLALIALGLVGASSAQSLSDAVREAVQTNPTVLSAERNRDAAEQGIGVARGGYLPRVDVLMGEGRERSKNGSTADHWESLNRHERTLILNQMLWDGLGTKSEVDRRRAIATSSAHRLDASAESIALDTVSAYLDVLRNRELLAYARDNLAAHEKTYDQVKLRTERGAGRRSDLEQITARMALAESNVASAESTLRDAETSFRLVVGKAPGELTMPTGQAPAIPATVDEAIARALEQHPVLRSAKADIEASQAQSHAAKSLFHPRLEFELSASNDRNIDGVRGDSYDRMAMLRLKWNLFRGGSDNSRVKEAAQQINEASEIAHRSAREVEAAVRLAYNALQAAQARLPSLERYVSSSDQARADYVMQFSVNQRTLLDMLDSENEYFTARSLLLNAKYIELNAGYRVLNTMGGLLGALGVPGPNDPAQDAQPAQPAEPMPAAEAAQTEQSAQPSAPAGTTATAK